jgi:hypothetical protein
MAIRQNKPQKLDSTVCSRFAFETAFSQFARSFSNSRIKSSADVQNSALCTLPLAFSIGASRRLKKP